MAQPSTAGYDPEWLALEQAFGGRNTLKGTVEEIQAQFIQTGMALAAMMPPPDPSVATVDEPASANINVRVYSPAQAQQGKRLPVGVYIHGGGFACGSLDSEDAFCRILAQLVPCVIVSTDYRKSPQHKLPVQFDDVMDGFMWAVKNAARFGGDGKTFFTIGGSAGGAMALATVDKCIETGADVSIKGVVALAPLTVHYDGVPAEYKAGYKARAEMAPDLALLNAATVDVFVEAADAKPDMVVAFPLLTKHAEHFPPTYIAVCGQDTLRDDGILMERKLREAGVKTKIDRYDGFPHYFWIFPTLVATNKFVGNTIRAIHWILAQP